MLLELQFKLKFSGIPYTYKANDKFPLVIKVKAYAISGRCQTDSAQLHFYMIAQQVRGHWFKSLQSSKLFLFFLHHCKDHLIISRNDVLLVISNPAARTQALNLPCLEAMNRIHFLTIIDAQMTNLQLMLHLVGGQGLGRGKVS